MSQVAENIVTLERVCKTCELSKPLAEFHIYAPGGIAHECEPCFRERERKRQRAKWKNDPEYRARHNQAGKAYRRGEMPPLKPVTAKGTEKVCKVCERLKPMSAFPLRGKGHRLHTCSRCYNDAENLKRRIRSREDPEFRAAQATKAKRSQWRSKYGVEIEEVVKTLELQHGLCANRGCGVEISLTAPRTEKKRAVVDHNHVTGKFRALLCDRCNILLGHIECSKNAVLGLMDYAEKHEIKEQNQ